MGNHRAERRGLGRRPSAPSTPATAGKRRAGRPVEVPVLEAVAAPVGAPVATPVGTPALEAAPVERTGVPNSRGRRVASRHSAPRGQLFRGLPSPPLLLGVAVLAISAGGAVTAGSHGTEKTTGFSQASAVSGVTPVSRVDLDRQTVSRDSERTALADAADARLVKRAEGRLAERDAALARFAHQAEQQAARLKAAREWVLPVDRGAYHLTARFGEYSGLWAHFHTGLDFAAPIGTPIHAVAAGVVTSVGYDGSYGNKTVVTLDDGTELWFCHQNSFAVTVGEHVAPGQVIGYVGGTGNVTGPHLHLEVRPGGGDPVDPYQALVAHGVQP
jgi:murein DD-endopeptidase MepM/ murein hydrolase activator NlpD